MDKQTIIADEARYMMQTYRRADVVLARGEGVHLYDSDGRRYPTSCPASLWPRWGTPTRR